ncbi:DUF2971 domain-containing protein [Halioxenophilus aromaticivorans]|uniref:DUF2971 domain-containing protein n=1 Tax=Halioxenophilus aromaticivorans TaxID=1306992 RepID=A0AAV3TZS9_9ALTE
MVNKTPDSLVKFCDTVTAEKILTSQALRWSAPHLFIDPFELNHTSELCFTPQELLAATVKHAVNLIFCPDRPGGSTPILQAIRRWRSEDRFASPDEADEVLRGLLKPLVNARDEYNQRLMQNWRSYCMRLRLCCFSSRLNNPMAWQQWGNHHRGVALRFNVGEHTDFEEPHKIQYQDTRPEISLLADQVEAVIKNFQEEHGQVFTDKFLTKAKSLAHQREWRCFKVISEKALARTDDDYSDIVFNGADLDAICFGLHTPKSARESLIEQALAINPNVRVLQTEMQPGSYQMAFRRKFIKSQMPELDPALEEDTGEDFDDLPDLDQDSISGDAALDQMLEEVSLPLNEHRA